MDNHKTENITKAATILAILIGLFLLIDLTGARQDIPDCHRVTNLRTGKTGLTRRPVNYLDLTSRCRYESLTGLFQWYDDVDCAVEITDDAAKSVEIGKMLTGKEVEEMRGRSNLNRAWDWLKKPR